jgi:hypothetical protein
MERKSEKVSLPHSIMPWCFAVCSQGLSETLIGVSERRRLRSWCFAALWLFIAIVSVHDAWLVLLFSDVIVDTEQNPVGRYLLQSTGGQVWLFLSAKAAGTVIVATLLLLAYVYRPTMALALAGPLSCFQMGLLLYLMLG